MENRLANEFLIALILTAAVAPQCMAASALQLTLVIYDHAHVSGERLTHVENTVSEIFEHAGVQLVWLDGFAYAAERRKAEIPAPEDPASLVVKLQPHDEHPLLVMRHGDQPWDFREDRGNRCP